MIGITGGIGTGKSIFTKYLIDKGYKVIESDKIAKDLIHNNSEIRLEIVKNFGSQSFTPEGFYNTKYISDIIFNDPLKYKKLNSIVHPPVIREIFKKAKSFLKESNFVFIESALIYEAFLDKKLDYVILFKSDISLRIKRLMDRDKISSDEFYKRVQFQIDPDEAEKIADFTIYNNSAIEDLFPKFDFLINLFNVLTSDK